jgi:hypothetical protein
MGLGASKWSVEQIIEFFSYFTPFWVILYTMWQTSGSDILIVNTMFGSGSLFASTIFLFVVSCRLFPLGNSGIIMSALLVLLLITAHLRAISLSIQPVTAETVVPGMQAEHFLLILFSSLAFSLSAAFRLFVVNRFKAEWTEAE